jgi:hypothetical protein
MNVDYFKGFIGSKDGIARSNLFRVKLPSLPGATSEEMNILCKDVQLPGRQIITNERMIGLTQQKLPYGYAVSEVSMTFHVMNDYGVKEYFETWQNLAVNQQSKTVGYQRGPRGYARTVEIEQLKKVTKLPKNMNQKNFSEGPLGGFLPKLTDLDIVQKFYGFTDQINDVVVYRCKLIDAFPTGMTAIQLNNELDGIVELNIQMSYTNWESPYVLSPTNVKDSLKSKISSTILGFIQ